MSLATDVKFRARQFGFDLVGICPAVTPTGVTLLRRWLEREFVGKMRYIAAARGVWAGSRH